MAVAAERAFELAADPEAYPEHFEAGLEPWQAAKFYLPAGRGSGQAEVELATTLTIPTGGFDPIFGATYEQLGQQSRAYHRSQDMGRWQPEGDGASNLHLVTSNVTDETTDTSLFAGLPFTVGDLANEVEDTALQGHLTDAQAAIDAAFDAYPDFAAVQFALEAGLSAVRAAQDRLAELGDDVDASRGR